MFNNGGGELNATHIPAALQEVLEINQIAERGNGAANNAIALLTYNRENGLLSFNGVYSVQGATNSEGGTSTTAVDDLGDAFDPGAEGTLSASNKRAALHQILEVFRAEQASRNLNWLTAFDHALNNTISFSGTIPVQGQLENGRMVFSAQDFPA